MNDDQSKDHELTESLLETSPKASTNPERKHRQKQKSSKYHNVPKRSSSLKRSDSTQDWEDYPDRAIVTNEPDPDLPDNSIKTTKYNWATFIPKNLLEQFSKLPNLYFLLIGILQMVPPITQTAGKPLIYLPLTLVITISAIKDLFEDLERRKDDTRENHSQTLKLTDKSFVQCQWKDLKVGDIIKVEEGEYIPADIVLLKTSEKKGSCAIETKNLDGETNLKAKTTDKKLMDFFKSEDDLWEKHIEINYEKQNPNLYSFTGTAKLDEETKIPLDMKNIALRACSLKTPWVIGVVVYSGHHTKIMLNSVGARPKSSRLENLMNKEVLTIFIIQNIWCLLSAIYATIWYESSKDFFLELLEESQSYKISSTFSYFIERYGTWLLLFTNLVPISLLVTLEMVKFMQAKVMEKDKRMIDSVIQSHTSVHTSSLMEELGQVQYVFSDKTGTLTRNVMEFQKFCVQDKSFGDNKDEEDMESKPQVSNVNFADKQFFEEFKNQDKSSDLHEMIFLLSVCHSASVEKSEDDEMKYTASSPDDIALVNFAKLCGYEYLDTDENNNIILKIDGKETKIKLLKQLEFTSERKMMSAIIENEDGKVILYCKGADSALLEKREKDENENIEAIKKNLHKYASDGLRTLLVGKREISKEEFEGWNKKYEEALCQLENREEAVSKCQEELEKDLTIIGATGIEDKLQDEVDETIDLLKKAGIKVWVLTGDKTETAINIGYSCKLLDDDQEIFVIDVQDQDELDHKIEEVSKKISHDKLGKEKAYAVVITGYAIVDAFNPDIHGGAAGKKLFEIFSEAKVVLGCRISPKQKKDIVELVKRHVPSAVTLAVGDGANDVNMITAAHVGVGIKGMEGYQAARASDFAIGEFKLLKRLLFFYGRETYRKNSYLVLYNFFKNIILILPHFWYGFYNGMSGTILYEPFIFQFFNVFYAAIPIIIFAVFDQEYDSQFLEKNPEYYTPGIKDNYFNFPIFWGWFGSASLQSIFIALIAFGSLEVGAVNKEGWMLGYWNSGMMAYTSVIICVNLKILLFSNTYNLLVALGIAVSIVTYVYSFKISSLIESSPDYSEYDLLIENFYFYFGLILMVCCTTLMDFAVAKYLHREELAQDKQSQKKLKKAHTQELEL